MNKKNDKQGNAPVPSSSNLVQSINDALVGVTDGGIIHQVRTTPSAPNYSSSHIAEAYHEDYRVG